MNPNRGENHLQSEVAPVSETSEGAQGQVVERAPSAPESSAGKQAPQTMAVTPVLDPAALAQPAAAVPIADDVSAQQPSASHPQGKNEDRIEKVWIDNAKEILARTQDDPHAQKEAVSKVKADYIQKRFNKVIRTDNAAP